MIITGLWHVLFRLFLSQLTNSSLKKNDFVGTLGVSKKGKYTFLTFKRYHLAFKYFQNNEIALS